MVSDRAEAAIIHRVVRNTASNYIGMLVTLAAGFFLTPFILRHLDAELYGLWILVGSVVAYGALLDCGIASAVTKYVAEYHARKHIEQARGLIATALTLYTGMGLIVILISALVAPIFPDLFNIPPEHRATAIKLVFLSGLGVGISIPCAAAPSVLRGLQRFDLTNLINTIGTILFVALTAAVLLSGGGVMGIVLVGIFVTLVTQALSVLCIYRIAPELRFGWRGGSRPLIRTVASFSSSMFLLHVGGQLESKTDEIVIGAYLPVYAVTPYNIARKLSGLPQILTEQFMKILLPLASELHAENNQARLRSLYTMSTRLTLALFIPIGCILVTLARPILSAWVGATYADYSSLVLILTLASLIDTSQWPAGLILQGMAQHRLTAVMAICTGLANLGLSILLVRHLGLVGVALGTLIPTSIICLGVVLPYAMRVIGVSSRTAIKEIFLPSLMPLIPMAIALYLLLQAVEPSSVFSIIAVASIGLLVYASVYLGVGASKVERQIYRGLALNTIRFAEVHLKR